MLFIAMPLALFVIYAGARLLAREKLESLGKFYRNTARFIIVMGFLLVVASAGAMIVHWCCHGSFMHGRGCCRDMDFPAMNAMPADHDPHRCCGHTGDEAGCSGRVHHCCMKKSQGMMGSCMADSSMDK